MSKVLVERPRGGGGRGGKGYLKELQRTPIEEQASREGIKARCRSGSKYFTDHLGPLQRFLASNVGRPWDLVYSEICKGTRKGFPVRQHFLTHVFQFVEKHVMLVDEVPCYGKGYAWGLPIRAHGMRYFYVCPRTGLLRRVPTIRSKKRSVG